VAKWRDVPAEFDWTESGLKPVRAKRKKPPAKVSVVGAVVQQGASSPSTTAVTLTPSAVQAASQETAQALDSILGLIKPASSIVEVPLSPVESGVKEDLWEAPVQLLEPAESAIYPEGRPITNPNHLMLFVWNGAEVWRIYTTTGWSSKLHRIDGKENPITNVIVEALIKAGHLVACREGIYRGVKS